MIAASLRPQLTLLPPDAAQHTWPAAPYCLHVDGPGLDEPFEALLEQPFLVVGRDRGCGLILPDTRVSRRHAYVHLTSDGVYVVYLSRRRGLPDDGLSPRGGWLAEPARLDVGPYQVVLSRAATNGHSGERAEPQRDLMRPVEGPSERPRLYMHAPEGRTAVRSIKRALTLIGRGKPAHLQVVHPSVSRPHCVLIEHHDRLWVVDLQSRHGTRVNGQRVEVARLDPSDRLALGDVAVEIQAGREAGRNGHSSHDRAGAVVELPQEASDPKSGEQWTEHASGVQAAPVHQSDDVPVHHDNVLSTQVDAPAHASVALQNEQDAPRQDVLDAWHAAASRAEQLEGRLDRQEQTLQALREGHEKTAARLENLEAQQTTARAQSDKHGDLTQELTERVERLSILCTEARDGSQLLHDEIRGLAGSIENIQQTLQGHQRAWHEQSEFVRTRLSEHEQQFSAIAATAEAAEHQEQSQRQAAWTKLQEAWEQQRREWNRHSSAIQQQRLALEEQIAALHQLREHWEQTGAELQAESERLRDAWEQQADALQREKTQWLERSEAVTRQQQATAECADRLSRQNDEHLQQWEQRHQAHVAEQVRVQQQFNELNEQRQAFELEWARMKERLDQEQRIAADQSQQPDDHAAQWSRLVDEQAERLEQFGRRLADLERADRSHRGNGHDVAAEVAACTQELRDEFRDALRRATREMKQQFKQSGTNGAAEALMGDHGSPHEDPAQPAQRDRPAEMPSADDDASDRSALDATPPDPESTPQAKADALFDQPRSTETDDLATQWLFQRTVTIRHDRQRRWRRRMIVAIGIASLAVVAAGGFAAWRFDLIGAAGRMLFG